MQLRLYDTISALQPYIKAICSMESNEGAEDLHAFRVLPDTCAELFVNYRQVPLAHIPGRTNDENARSFVVFRMSSFMDVQLQPGLGCITVCFQPGTAHYFFPLPMDEVSDSITALKYLWKNVAMEMEEKVAGAKTNEERVAIIQQFLLRQVTAKKYPEDKRLQHCLWQINLLKGQVSVNELSKHANLSERQLSRHFKNCVGLSPKEYTKVNRFIHSLLQLKKYPALSLTAIAYESGYYDQAHFIHDYKTYAGLTPGELLSQNNVLF